MTKSELRTRGLKIKSGFAEFKKDIEDQLTEQINKQGKIIEVYREAASHGDLRENAEYQSAEKDLALCNAAIGNLSAQLKNINMLVDETEEYFPMDMVVMYSTVYLVSNTGREEVVVLYPNGVSDLQRHFISADSPIGKAIWQKEVGYEFTIEHNVTGEPVTWLIKGIY